MGAPLRLIYSLITIWGPPRINLFAYYMGPPRMSFFAFYMGPPQVSFFAYCMGAPLRSVSSLTMWGPLRLISSLTTQQTMVCRFGSVVQITSESSADRLKVGRTSESNWILIFGNNSGDCKRNQCSSNFQVILWHNFSFEGLVKVV